MTDNNKLSYSLSDLVEKLESEIDSYKIGTSEAIARAYAAGADQELEACCEWLQYELRHKGQSLQWSDDLRAHRRPKPPSLKEQALEALDEEHADMRIQNYKLIRSVLESLPD